MPFGDRTGPGGTGPMTGRGGGFCGGQGHPGYASSPRGVGAGSRGRGGRRGWRNQFHATGLFGWQRWGGSPASDATERRPGSEQEIGVLKSQAKQFETALDGIRNRIEQLQQKATPD